MSVEAITWALRQPVPSSSAKFVLVVLANCASAVDLCCYPSIAYIVEATGQDRKTVIANLERLVEWGLIVDTGDRAGRTKQIPVYRLRGEDLLGSLPNSEQFQKRNSSNSPRKESRFSAETVPETGHGTVINPQGTGASERATSPTLAGEACLAMRQAGCPLTNPSNPNLLAALAEGVTPQALADFARAALEQGVRNPFAYAIAAARGANGDQAHEHTRTSPRGGGRLSAVDRVVRRIQDRDQPSHDRDAIAGTAVRVVAR